MKFEETEYHWQQRHMQNLLKQIEVISQNRELDSPYTPLCRGLIEANMSMSLGEYLEIRRTPLSMTPGDMVEEIRQGTGYGKDIFQDFRDTLARTQDVPSALRHILEVYTELPRIRRESRKELSKELGNYFADAAEKTGKTETPRQAPAARQHHTKPKEPAEKRRPR